MYSYTAIELLLADLKGGSTRPWKVRALRSDGKLVDVAVKLYSEKDVSQYQPVAKELYGYFFARFFGLKVADFGLIDLPAEFMETLSQENRVRLNTVHTGFQFAVEWVPDAAIVDVANLNRSVYSQYEVALVYAFDVLIWNGDRRLDKPNLLFTDEEFFLIDHEMCFPFGNDKYLVEFGIGQWSYPFHRHLFYPHLRSLIRKTKLSLFDEFEEYLRRFHVASIVELQEFMYDNLVQIPDNKLISQHLRTLQSNSNSFTQILIQSIL